MKKISIIIPTLNEGLGITDFLNALQPLREHCELILVDGESADNTVELAANYVDQLIHINFIDSNKGRAIQMNAGADIATAPILLFLHADTYLPTSAVNDIQKAISQGYLWGRFDLQFNDPTWALSVVSWMMNQRSRLTGIATGDQGIFIDITLFQQLNGFAKINLMEDIELSTRLKKIGKPYCIENKLQTSARRWRQFGVFKTITLMWALRLQYFFGVNPSVLSERYSRGWLWKKA